MAKLLVVDDDEDISAPLEQILTAEGHGVEVAGNGYEGLSSIAVRPPDLIILDIEMPRLTGPQMAYDLVLLDSGKERIPILLLSGAANLKQVAGAIGTPYVLAKPFDVDRLLALVKLALKERIAPTPAPAKGADESQS